MLAALRFRGFVAISVVASHRFFICLIDHHVCCIPIAFGIIFGLKVFLCILAFFFSVLYALCSQYSCVLLTQHGYNIR